MRFLGEILVNLQSHDVVFAFQIDDGSSPAYVLFCDSKRKFPVGRFVSDDVFRFKRWHEAIDNQNDRDCRHRFHGVRLTRHFGLKGQLLLCLSGTDKSQDL